MTLKDLLTIVAPDLLQKEITLEDFSKEDVSNALVEVLMQGVKSTYVFISGEDMEFIRKIQDEKDSLSVRISANPGSYAYLFVYPPDGSEPPILSTIIDLSGFTVEEYIPKNYRIKDSLNILINNIHPDREPYVVGLTIPGIEEKLLETMIKNKLLGGVWNG